jgi:hypothetical protein
VNNTFGSSIQFRWDAFVERSNLRDAH